MIPIYSAMQCPSPISMQYSMTFLLLSSLALCYLTRSFCPNDHPVATLCHSILSSSDHHIQWFHVLHALVCPWAAWAIIGGWNRMMVIRITADSEAGLLGYTPTGTSFTATCITQPNKQYCFEYYLKCIIVNI